MGYFFWKVSKPNNEQNMAAAWYGNDTVWRMVLDINQIAIFGKADGTLSNQPQRELFCLSDGIIAGQGNGPLKPEMFGLGIVAFSNNAALMDYTSGLLMGLEVNKISLLRNAFEWFKNLDYKIVFNNKLCTFDQLLKYKINAKMPPGWINYNR